MRICTAYAFIHPEEEIRREALVKDCGAFVRFLQLAAAESGQILNYANISQEAGISQPTVKSYYQLLEDMFVGVRVPASAKSPRKNLLSTPKFLIFDLGVRHAAAGLTASPNAVKANPGPMFEQWVGIELWKRLQYLGAGKLYHQRTKDGAEGDFITEQRGKLTPIEIKRTVRPTLNDARHVRVFLDENAKVVQQGYVVCRCPRPLQFDEEITALPWFCLKQRFGRKICLQITGKRAVNTGTKPTGQLGSGSYGDFGVSDVCGRSCVCVAAGEVRSCRRATEMSWLPPPTGQRGDCRQSTPLPSI